MMNADVRILVAEDDAIVARDLEETLGGLGYEVVATVSTGPDAVMAARRSHPDLALMDVRMPGEMDGIEAGRRIMDDLKIPVVYVTAYGDDHTMERALEWGPFGYVLKPFDDRDLKAAIEVGVYRGWMERRLRASEQRFAATLRSIGEAVVATDARGHVSFMNHEAERMTGWKEEEALGKKISSVVRLHAAGPDGPAVNPVARALRTGETVTLDPATVLVGGHGSIHPVSDSVAPVMTWDGTVLGAVLVLRDETEARKLMDQINQIQKLDALGRLAGGIAHDFNNILTTIRGYADLLLVDGELRPEVVRDLSEIREAAARAGGLTRQLLTFSRSDAVRPELLEPNAVIEEMIRMLRRIVGEDVVLRTDLAPELPRVRMDPSRFQQVVLNLVVNARDAMPEGGEIVIRTLDRRPGETDHGDLREGGDRPERAVAIAVSDTGEGMSERELERLFEPYFTTKDGGAGLGLATVWGIVGQAGGTVAVDSKEGSGMTFRVLLPGAAGE